MWRIEGVFQYFTTSFNSTRGNSAFCGRERCPDGLIFFLFAMVLHSKDTPNMII
jgi:hypothetical protein